MTTIVDRVEPAADRIRDDDDFLADKKRFESFKLGGSSPPSQSRRHSHSRSHSRNLSISISLPHSLSFPPSHAISSSSLSQLGSTATKRSSHHRRRSSVSTRRESAEVMGVVLPTPSNSDDNMALGDKDSIRRCALWALEGKPRPDGFSPVEIPELNTPEIARRISELPSKPSFPPAMGSFISGLSGLANMRDSFSNRMSSSIKDQLHTLVEEEEEEEEPDAPPSASLCESPAEAGAFPGSVTTSPTPTRTRHRPACLDLRPLSLSPEKFISPPNGELPAPAPTSTPPKPSGLKSLTLTSSPNLISSPPTSDGVLSNATALNRRSVVVPPTHPASSAPFFRRPSLTDSTSSGFSDPFELPRKRSSISYKSSFHGLPTPELTPTTDRRASTGSDSDWGRPSSITHEQHFLYQSQAALVARISELERTLSFRTQSRPVSVSVATSDFSSSASEPTDEMLRLVTDLKAERDELTRDVDGWRMRVGDLEKQTGALALRLDAERREAWIARERLGLLQIEKRAALRSAEESGAAVVSLQAELAATKEDLRAAQEEMAHELDRVQTILAKERRRREELEEALEELCLLKTPTTLVPAFRVTSIDSMSSTTDVESLDGRVVTGPELKAVQEVEEEEEEELCSDQENNLIGYEDEEEGDQSLILHDGSTFSSLEDIPRSIAHLVPCVASSPSCASTPTSISAHVRHSSLSRDWSFPVKGTLHAASPQHVPEEVDRFFGCLEDIGDSPPISDAAPETTNPFLRGFFAGVEEEGDELPPFVLPADVGIEVESSPVQGSAGLGLSTVLEEEEPQDLSAEDDEFVGEEDEGGIKFTFDIPSAFASPASSPTPSPITPPVLTPLSRTPVPYYEPAIEDDNDMHFSFPAAPFVSRASASPPSPSGIPRATALKRFEGSAKDAKSSPSRISPSLPAALPHISPSGKSGGVRPSFIPQPIAKAVAAPTFISQPAIKARAPSSITSAQSQSQPLSGETALSASPHPFAALQNLASFMPLSSPFSWSGMRALSSKGSSMEENPNKGEKEQKKGFVSKDRQLARLRERMAAEEGGVIVAQARAMPCRRCVDRVVAP